MKISGLLAMSLELPPKNRSQDVTCLSMIKSSDNISRSHMGSPREVHFEMGNTVEQILLFSVAVAALTSLSRYSI